MSYLPTRRTCLLALVALAALSMHASCANGGAGGDVSTQPADAHPEPSDKTRASNAVVVELFTSEGCSSCPPADDLLSQLVREYAAKNRPVFFLAFHVDYWNNLGWPDRFAQPQFTQRQHDYAAAFKADSVYTPQMIVNGVSEFVGSDRAKATAAINAAIRSSQSVTLEASLVSQVSDGVIKTDYRVSATSPGSSICAAVVESGLSSDVRRGENAGHVLRHDMVVRAFSEMPMKLAKGAISIDLPKSLKPENSEVVLFVQDVRSRAIVATSAVRLPSPRGDGKL